MLKGIFLTNKLLEKKFILIHVISLVWFSNKTYEFFGNHPSMSYF